MNYSASLLMFLVLALFAAVNCSDDSKCRDFAKKVGMDQQSIEQVTMFRLYGPPRAAKTCQDVCQEHEMAVGFDYVGKQACCCGKN